MAEVERQLDLRNRSIVLLAANLLLRRARSIDGDERTVVLARQIAQRLYATVESCTNGVRLVFLPPPAEEPKSP